MLSPILAFRPARVAERLGRRSDACALAPGELLGPAAALGVALAVVRASVPAVARGALVAAKELGAPLGLSLRAGGPGPERWFDGVAEAADEIAAGLPIFLSGEVVVAGDAPAALDQALREAWALADAGVTHLAIDASAVSPAERPRVLAALAEPAIERGVALDLVVELAALGARAARAAAVLDELRRAHVHPAIVSVRCPAALDAAAAGGQAGLLARLAEGARGVAVMRRGPVGEPLLAALAGIPVRLVEDGGAAEASALAGLPAGLRVEAPGPRGEGRLELAAPLLADDARDRLEARAYLETHGLLSRLGLTGTAPRIVRALARRLERGRT